MPHQRRKSGGLLSPSDSRKSVTVSEFTKSSTRPAMPRRFATKAPKSPRSRQDSWDSEDESFPQFCMTCEKQFVPHDDKFLYCSESCRRVDQQSSSPASTAAVPTFNPSHEFFLHDEPRDIIPQASPSRPSSTLFATTPPSDSSHGTYNYHHESAVSALRSSLNASSGRPPSPQSLSASASYWPFRRGSGANGDGSSYYKTSSTYDAAYYGADRPLPTRQPIGYRSKSIELVTPILTR